MQKYHKEYIKDIAIDSVLPTLKAETRKQVLLELSKEAAKHSGANAQIIYKTLCTAEEKHSSGIGDFVAIPHAKLKNLPQAITILARLHTPVSFDSNDGQPVDIACLVLSPERDGPLHLRRLSRISRLLKNKELHNKIKETNDAQTIRMLVIAPDGWLMAA